MAPMLGSVTGTHSRMCPFVRSVGKVFTHDSNRSATTGLDARSGKGSNGGVWEWSSTVLDTHDGFAGTTIFPGYSSDFFDTKHQVVVSPLVWLVAYPS